MACGFKFEGALTDTGHLYRLSFKPSPMAVSVSLLDMAANEIRRRRLKRVMYSLPSYGAASSIYAAGCNRCVLCAG